MNAEQDSPSGGHPLDEHEAQGERAPLEPEDKYTNADRGGSSEDRQPSEGKAGDAPFNPSLAWVTCGNRSRLIQSNDSLDEVERFIREGLQDPTNRYRGLLAAGDPSAKQYKASAFPGIVVGGSMPIGSIRKGAFPTVHSELVQFDLDIKKLRIDREEAPALRERAVQHDAVPLAFVSPSVGVKAFVRVTPVPTTAQENHAAWEAGTRALCEHLGIPFQEADPLVKAADGLCFLCHDPDVRRNLHPGAVSWEMPKKEKEPASPGRKRSRRSERAADEPPRDAGDFLEAGVNAAIEFLCPSDEYGQWLAELACLKSWGLSQEEVEAWSSQGAKYEPGEVLQRWDGLPADPREEAGEKLWAAARAQGWTPPGSTGRPGVSFSASPEFLGELVEDYRSGRNRLTSHDASAAAYRYCRQYADDTLVVLPQIARAAASMGRRRFVRVLLLDRSTGLWSEADSEIDLRLTAVMDQAVDHAYLLLKERQISSGQFGSIVKKVNENRTPAAADAMVQALPGVALSMPENGRPRVCRLDELDTLPGYLPVENGIVDLRKGCLVPAEEARGLLFQIRPGTPQFVPDARHPIVDHLLSHLDPEKGEFIWNWCGRGMHGTPNRENGMLALCGTTPEGGEGKTTFLNGLYVGVGPGHMGRISSDAVSKRGRGKHGPTPERQVLIDMLFAFSEETSGWDICEETTKDLTGGGTISFQPKYAPEVTMPVRASIIMSANSLPRFGEDPAMRERLHVVTFTKPPHPDPAYARAVDPKNPDPAVAEAILARLCRAAREHPPEADPLPIPGLVGQGTEAFVDSIRDDSSIWVQNVVVRDDNGFLSTDDLWRAWLRHCQAPASAERAGEITKRQLLGIFRNTWKALAAQVVTKDGESIRGWYGYALLPEVQHGE